MNNLNTFDMSRSEIISRICDEGVIGDGIHFVYELPKLGDVRIKYLLYEIE